MTAIAEPVAVTERTPPADVNAERIVLGAMMLTTDAITDVTEHLETRHYYQPIHATIHQAILTLYGRGEPTDPYAVTAHLADTKQISRVGGAPYLHDCVAAVPTAANAGYYARLVARAAYRRGLITAGMRITQLGYEAIDAQPAELGDRAGQLLYEATASHTTADLISIGDLIDPTLEAIEQAGKRSGLVGLPTGLIDLDRLTNGAQPGQLWVIAGRPGMGKSVCAMDIARATALRKHRPVLVNSLEMSRDELTKRVISAETGVHLSRILSGRLDDNEWAAIAAAASEIADAPLYIDDTAHATVADIRAKARRLAQRGALDLVIVDYLQLMGGGSRGEPREQVVAGISRGLKLLAKELAVPVIAVSQLNRGPEARTDKKPQLSDLRESGAVEQDCDVAILLHRDDYYTRAKSNRPGEIDLVVAKNRHGRQGEVIAAAQLHCSRIVDMHPEAMIGGSR